MPTSLDGSEVLMADGGRLPEIQELIERHHALLYRYAYRLCGSVVDADDLTQQTYLIAHEKLHQLRDADSAKSWLCTILRHAFLRLRRQPAMQSLDHGTEPRQRESDTICDEEALQRALGELPEEYRSAVILYYFQELSYREIAGILGVPLGTVMSRLSRGKSQLKFFLEARESPRPARSPSGHALPNLVPAIPN